MVGGVSLNKIDSKNGSAGGGIWIASQHQALGFGHEAFEAKIQFAFCELGLTKLINGYFEGNVNSWAMQRKLGYRRIGKANSRCMADGRQTIEHVTMLLRSEWEKRIATPYDRLAVNHLAAIAFVTVATQWLK